MSPSVCVGDCWLCTEVNQLVSGDLLPALPSSLENTPESHQLWGAVTVRTVSAGFIGMFGSFCILVQSLLLILAFN